MMQAAQIFQLLHTHETSYIAIVKLWNFMNNLMISNLRKSLKRGLMVCVYGNLYLTVGCATFKRRDFEMTLSVWNCVC